MTAGDKEKEIQKTEDDFTTDFSKDENESRGNWSGQLDFILACLGYAVGLGNVWRFPFLCYRNGGAVFFIPYIIMLVFVGMPIFFFELSLGQFTSSGVLTCWHMAPFFKGIGVGMVIVSGMVAVYYNMIIAWSFFYLFASFTSDLPWQYCNLPTSSDYCELNLVKNITEATCVNGLSPNTTIGVCFNDTTGKPHGIYNTSLAMQNNIRAFVPTEDYYLGRMLGRRDLNGIEDIGPIRWELALCLLLSWIIVFLSLVNGIKSSGKVVYFTALFPYLVLIILLVRGVLLEGHLEGIRFYILNVQTERLMEFSVWKDAAVQIFFSLSASWGGLISLASYNRYHNNCLRDTLVVSISNCLTSFFAGFVIFSFLGFLAVRSGAHIDTIVESGPGLAFVVYPEAVVQMPVSTLWAILFFLMLITLGLDTQFALLETVTTALFDQWPVLRKRKWITIGIIAVIFYFIGLVFCTDGGEYVVQLVDSYASGWNVLVIGLLECLCIGYIYALVPNGKSGFLRFREDVSTMIGKSCCFDYCYFYWVFLWMFLTPVGTLFILLSSWIDYSPASLGDYTYPTWADGIGWAMTCSVVVGIFVTGIVIIIQHAWKGDIGGAFRPTKYWGPALPKHRQLVQEHVPELVIDPWAEDVEMNTVSVAF